MNNLILDTQISRETKGNIRLIHINILIQKSTIQIKEFQTKTITSGSLSDQQAIISEEYVSDKRPLRTRSMSL